MERETPKRRNRLAYITNNKKAEKRIDKMLKAESKADRKRIKKIRAGVEALEVDFVRRFGPEPRSEAELIRIVSNPTYPARARQEATDELRERVTKSRFTAVMMGVK